MAWRFVQQPNGLFARFSEIVDNFTACNLTKEQAINICLNERLSQWDAEAKVERAVEAGLTRWHEAIATITNVHGIKEADDITIEILGDTALYATAREQCKRRGIPVKYAIRIVHLFVEQQS